MFALDKYKNLRVLVSSPSHGEWKDKFGMCMLNMFGHFMSHKVGEYKTQAVIPHSPKGTILPKSRASAVKQVAEQRATHLCFIDTDQTFPKDILHRLVLADKDVIGCNIAIKVYPSQPTARAKDGTFYGTPVFTDENSPDYEKVWRIGAGIVMLKKRVVEKIGHKCFGMPWIEEIQDYMGEDWSMMEAIEKAGFDVWVDHRLSAEIGHVGDFVYTHDFVGELQNPEAVNERSG